jgi:hypothetical protein
MNDPAVKVSVRDGTVTISFPARLLRGMVSPRSRRKAAQQPALRAARGMWKRRRIDALAYQREIRGEWN